MQLGHACSHALDDLLVIKIDKASILIEDHIFQNGAEFDGLPDLWLRRSLEANALGIAAAFNVEDATVTPAVLIISYQRPGLVC